MKRLEELREKRGQAGADLDLALGRLGKAVAQARALAAGDLPGAGAAALAGARSAAEQAGAGAVEDAWKLANDARFLDRLIEAMLAEIRAGR